MEKEKKETSATAEASSSDKKSAKQSGSSEAKTEETPASQDRGQGRGRKRRRLSKREDRRAEFDSKIVSIRRVTRVVAGGRRFSFSVALVAGDRKGRVGVGTGKASDTALAIEKAMRDAKKHMLKVPLSKEMRMPHEVTSKYCASEILLVPSIGRGVAAGSSVRTVLELGGIRDVTGKILSRSKNQLNNARATVDALRKLNA